MSKLSKLRDFQFKHSFELANIYEKNQGKFYTEKELEQALNLHITPLISLVNKSYYKTYVKHLLKRGFLTKYDLPPNFYKLLKATHPQEASPSYYLFEKPTIISNYASPELLAKVNTLMTHTFIQDYVEGPLRNPNHLANKLTWQDMDKIYQPQIVASAKFLAKTKTLSKLNNALYDIVVNELQPLMVIGDIAQEKAFLLSIPPDGAKTEAIELKLSPAEIELITSLDSISEGIARLSTNNFLTERPLTTFSHLALTSSDFLKEIQDTLKVKEALEEIEPKINATFTDSKKELVMLWLVSAKNANRYCLNRHALEVELILTALDFRLNFATKLPDLLALKTNQKVMNF